METATTERPAPSAAPTGARGRLRRAAAASAGPALIVVSVVVALRGFAFIPRLTDQHPDVLTFWLPRSCLLGDALADGRVPLWNPFEMAGTPYAADPQSGWLSLPMMLFSGVLGCGDGLRAIIVANPILAGLGLWWFLRKEGLGRPAATAGGLSLAMAVAASNLAISLPFAGTLAWTPFALVGASGFFSARGVRRAAWLALAAVAWGQVAASHLSHGLVMGTMLVLAYVAARVVREIRTDASTRWAVLALGAGFLAFLPLANLAILVPHLSLVSRSSLREGYEAFGGTIPPVVGVERPISTKGIWSGWPFALASTPGAYVGAATLLALPFALRDRARRHLVVAFAVAGAAAYALTLSVLVAAGWFRSLVLGLPFGDVYLHNPGRLRYLAFLVVPVLGAIGVQWQLDRRPSLREAAPGLGAGLVAFLVLPLLLGVSADRFVVFAIGCAASIAVVRAFARVRRWAPVVLVGVLAAELLAGALWSSAYRGGTVYLGLEAGDRPVLVNGPLRWPEVQVARYLEPGEIARWIEARGDADGRYLAWIPPSAYFNKGYLFDRGEVNWPALLIGRGVLFEIHDALGYSPIQLPRYWSFIRATNQLPVFYNAAVIQVPAPEDARLLGIRYLIVHEGQPLPDSLHGTLVASERGFLLYELDGWQPRASVVPAWTVVDGPAQALDLVLERGFDPSATAALEEDPGIAPGPPGTLAGSADYREERPEDVRIVAEAASPSLVVIRNAWDRGWSATVDGRPAPVLRADHLLQAVPIPAGRHEVRLVYREPSIARGLVASGLAWGALGLVIVAAPLARRAMRRRAPPPAA